MLNYHLHLPTKMGFKQLLYPRRRGFVIKIIGFCTFLCLVCLWVKSDSSDSSLDNADVRPRHVNHIPAALEKTQGPPVAQVAPQPGLGHVGPGHMGGPDQDHDVPQIVHMDPPVPVLPAVPVKVPEIPAPEVKRPTKFNNADVMENNKETKLGGKNIRGNI